MTGCRFGNKPIDQGDVKLLRLHQQGSISRLDPILSDQAFCDQIVEAIRTSEATALAGSREPFRALNYRGTTGWQEALNDLGKVLDEYGWGFLRVSQPTFTAPEGLFPTRVDLFLFHGDCSGGEIITTARGGETLKKLNQNAIQLSLFGEDEPALPVAAGFYLALVVSVNQRDEVSVYLALAVGEGPTKTRIRCDEIAMLHNTPIPLDALPLVGEDGDGSTIEQPVVAPITPVIGDIEQAS